jgi:hypothetical protein
MIRERVAAARNSGERVEVWLNDGWWAGRVLEPSGPGGRGLHSSTSQLNLSRC